MGSPGFGSEAGGGQAAVDQVGRYWIIFSLRSMIWTRPAWSAAATGTLPDMVISSDDLVRRNAAFAATGAFAGLAFPTSDTLQVLGCVDSRVDPGDVLGLELGEAVVMRNIGGRITPAALRSWALLGRLSQGQPPGGHLVILHHTDCGITRLADYPEQLAAFFEIPVDELESKAVTDPYAASWAG